MKFLFLLLFPILVFAGADYSNTFTIGKGGAAGNKNLELGASGDRGCFRYNDTSNKVEFSHDCSTYAEVGSGASESENSSYLIKNLGVTAVTGSSALTITITDGDGSTPDSASPVIAGFNSSTAATGQFSLNTTISSISTVISSGSTAGQASGVAAYIYVYLINAGGSSEVAWSGSLWDEGTLVTTTAEGGAGAADSASLIYSTTSRSNVPIRLVARLLNTQATAGTWATNPSEISLPPFDKKFRFVEGNSSSNTNWPVAAGEFFDVATIVLPKGTWMVCINLGTNNNGAITTTGILIGLSLTSGNSGTGLIRGYNYFDNSDLPLSSGGGFTISGCTRNSSTTGTTAYFKARAESSVTNLRYIYSYFAWKLGENQ